MDFTQSKGNVTELQCISKFIEFGIECSLPYGNGAKYDFIADIEGNLIRIQCKSSSRIDDNSFKFHCRSQTTNTQKTVSHRYTQKDIDYFSTFYMGNVYLVPVNECSLCKTLRFSAPKNNIQNVNMADDYEIKKVLLRDFGFSEFDQQQLQEKEFNKKKYYCARCGKIEVTKEGNYCVGCARIASRVVDRPEREKLKEMVRNESFNSIGKMYGVSNKSVVRWCEYYGIPSRKSEIKNITDEDWRKI